MTGEHHLKLQLLEDLGDVGVVALHPISLVLPRIVLHEVIAFLAQARETGPIIGRGSVRVAEFFVAEFGG